MTIEYGNREQQAEKANLRARAPFDRAGAVLEETVRAFARLVDDSKLIVTRCAARLTELEREVLEVAEETGSRAGAKFPKLPRRESLKAAIPWCDCGLFTEQHVHHDRQPDEVAP